MAAKNRLVLSCLAISLFVLLSLTNVSLPAYATTYYVDATNGNDFNNGLSPETAWKTISKVNSMNFKPGDTILFKRGEIWREQLIVPSSGTEGNPITFGAYGEGEKPIIHGGIIIPNDNWNGPDANGVYSYTYTRTIIFIAEDGEPLKKASDATCADGNWYWNDVNNILYYKPTSGDPSNHVVERISDARCINADNRQHIVCENLHLNLCYAGVSGSAFAQSIIDIVVSNCEISKCRMGILFFARNGHDNSNIILSNNVLTNNGESIYFSSLGALGGTEKNIGHIIENNVIQDTGYATSSLFWNDIIDGDVEAMGFQNLNNSEVIGNQIIGGAPNGGIVVWTNPSSTSDSNSFLRNYIKDVLGAGLILGSYATNNTIAYNIIVNCGLGGPHPRGGIRLGICSTTGNKVYNNTLIGNDWNIYVYPNGDYYSIKNNISFNPVYGHIAKEGEIANNIFDYNDYYPDTGNKFCLNGIRYNFEGWKDTSFQDAFSIVENPMFVDVVNNNFHLQSNSLCINKGTDVGLTEDMEGNPVDYAPDIGAYEYSELNHTEIHVYSQPSSNPTPEILANGSDSPITLSQADTLTLTISLKNNGVINNADWWLAKDTPSGLYFFTFEGWTTDWVPGYQGPLFNLDSFEVLNVPASEFPVGTYTFYFCIDTNMDNNITWDSLYCDSIVVNITE